MITITLSGNAATLEGYPKPQELQRYLSVPKPYNPNASVHAVDYTTLLHKKRNKEIYYIGLGWYKKLLATMELLHGITPQMVNILDLRRKVVIEKDLDNYDIKMTPYNHQVEAAKAVLRPVNIGGNLFSRGVVKVGVGGGKTLLSVMLFTKIVNCRMVFITTDAILIKQVKADFKEEIGINVDSLSNFDEDSRIVITTPRKLFNFIKIKENKDKVAQLKKFNTMLADECHDLGDSGKDSINLLGLTVVIGMSGTPFSRSTELLNKELETVIGGMVYEIKQSELEALGVTAKVTINMLINKTYYHGRDYNELKYDIQMDVDRLKQFADIQIADNTAKFLAITKTIGQFVLAADVFREAGLNFRVVSGDASANERKEILDTLDAYDGIIANYVFKQGVNKNILKRLFVLVTEKDLTYILQYIGRILRLLGMEEGEVYDTYELNHKKLREHSDARVSAYLEEGYKVVFIGDDDDVRKLTNKYKL